MQRNTVLQLIALGVFASCVAAAGFVSTRLTSSSSRHQLVYTEHTAEGLPAAVGLGVALGPVRGFFVNFLWMRANQLKDDGRFHEAMNLSRAITALQPRYPHVWVFHAWNMAYNISVTSSDRHERWQWVNNGIQLLRNDAIRFNNSDLLIHKELGWIFLHKISGVTDDANQFYKRELAAEWTEVLGEPPRLGPVLSASLARTLSESLRGTHGYRLQLPRNEGERIARRFTSVARADFEQTLEEGVGPDNTLTRRQAEALAEMLERFGVAGELPRIPLSQYLAGALYEAWFGPVAAAPETMAELYQRNPQTRALVEAIRANVTTNLDRTFLQRYTRTRAIANSVYRDRLDQVGPRSRALFDLVEDERFADAWPALLNHVRRRVLIDHYNMEPSRMIRYTRRFGPIDWRHPAAHALYWTTRGVELSLRRVEDRNQDDFDFINTDRQVMHALQELYRFGDLYFSYLYHVFPSLRLDRGQLADGMVIDSLYRAVPNAYFIDTYAQTLEELRERANQFGIFEDYRRRTYTLYSAGYENFLKDAIRFLYRRGEIERANYYHEKLITYDKRNVHYAALTYELATSIDEFVREQFSEDRFKTHYVAVSEIEAALQGAFINGLLTGNDTLFQRNFAYARAFHRAYVREQVEGMDLAAAGGRGRARMEVVDRDFRWVAGSTFMDLISTLDISDAERVYDAAPEDLRRFGYWIMQREVGSARNPEIALGGREFNDVFPEPPGMDEFERWMDEQLTRFRSN
ncbi:MAG: hypothetical protein EA423_04180 [Phycisphaerales bacterium]|nr:MAG: hypothetical protein EA423_04180 [Phycisphaerales bacterium]